jgi:hypothetical protein
VQHKVTLHGPAEMTHLRSIWCWQICDAYICWTSVCRSKCVRCRHCFVHRDFGQYMWLHDSAGYCLCRCCLSAWWTSRTGRQTPHGNRGTTSGTAREPSTCLTACRNGAARLTHAREMLQQSHVMLQCRAAVAISGRQVLQQVMFVCVMQEWGKERFRDAA